MTTTQTNTGATPASQIEQSLTKGWTTSVDADGERDDGTELPALSERSDAWLVGRARELLAAHGGERDERHRRTEELDRLLAEAQHLGETLMDIGQVLTQLGVYEVADKVMKRAHRYIRDSGGPQMISVALVNRTRLLLGWGLRLERIGETSQAIGRFTTAAAIATAVEALFLERPDEAESTMCPVVRSAEALAHPEFRHVE